jgi:hypothetical protein
VYTAHIPQVCVLFVFEGTTTNSLTAPLTICGIELFSSLPHAPTNNFSFAAPTNPYASIGNTLVAPVTPMMSITYALVVLP